jgi:threonyl-tRNA synthetase
MAELQLTMPDGSVRAYPSGTTGMAVAESISPRLAKEAIAVKVGGVVKDLFASIPANAPIQILTFDQPEGREVFWHSSSHIMAEAVLAVFPKARLAIGPPIDEGWYYDFEVEKPFSPEDIEKIEKKMSEIVAADASFSCKVWNRREAIDYYKSKKADYKVEILDGITDETVTFYYQNTFEDMCRGPHIPRTGIVKAFKLIATSGAYWRGDEKRQMLQRIYGVSYPKQAMLDEYLKRLEEAKKRDHRVLGKQLELFTVAEEIGAGLILWLPRGSRMRNIVENFWREQHTKHGYELVFSPHIANRALWDKSGHTDFYSDNMFGPMQVDDRQYQLKPMNCPFHIMMYKSRMWSYRDLPLRWAELGTVYRYERAGVLHGLMRVRGFTQDDAHHFVQQEKMESEIGWILDFCIFMLKSFGFEDFNVFLSTRPEKAIGEHADWARAEAALKMALEKAGITYSVDAGGGAFYGPKIDIQIRDAIGRSWQCSTIQFDFSLPERFDLNYIDSDGKQKRPFMIHRALLGSLERFFGVLIEHYAGNFPVWLAPVQVKVLPITDNQNQYAETVFDRLRVEGFRVELDSRSEKIGAKIRDAEVHKVPYMFVVGGKEAEANSVSVRKHGTGDLGVKSIDDAISLLTQEVNSAQLSRA